MRKVEVITQILNANDLIARQNRELLKEHRILAVNLMASPGAGKTSLILQTAKALSDRVRLGVIEGMWLPVLMRTKLPRWTFRSFRSIREGNVISMP
jgi:hydrogenase nickel incorporation protein HypB